jgi:energy-coupling factor transport system ATP-binding protein
MSIELRNVSCLRGAGTPGETAALQDVSLSLRPGELVGIMGATGSGKTTLLRILAGLLPPTRGRVELEGRDVSAPDFDRSVLRSAVGLVFQDPASQLFETTVERDAAFGLRRSGLSREEIAGRVRRALEEMGFEYQAVRRLSPLTLSGGEKRRAAIAGVLVSQPRYLLFDEPAAGLDPRGRETFWALARRLRDAGAAVAVVSHSPDELAQAAERIVVLCRGAVALDGPPETVFSDSEQLTRLGLDLPAPRRCARLLAQAGVPLPEDILRYEQLLSALKTILPKGGDAL